MFFLKTNLGVYVSKVKLLNSKYNHNLTKYSNLNILSIKSFQATNNTIILHHVYKSYKLGKELV